jgi:hypothetical protein
MEPGSGRLSGSRHNSVKLLPLNRMVVVRMSGLSEEERYRQLAAEARASAARATDAYDKRTLLLVAQRYDILAERAKRRPFEESA